MSALVRSVGIAAPVAVAVAMAAAWHADQPRPAMQAKIVEAAPAVPRQYMALVAMTEQADPVSEGEKAREENQRLGFVDGGMAVARPFRAVGQAGEDHDRALQCLTQAIYYEAAREPEGGQRAVAQVVLNRVRHPAFAKTVCGVVYQQFNAAVCQFSFVCDGSLARRPLPALWDRAKRIASDALAGRVEKSVGTATHYHADYVFPRWAPHLGKLAQIGAHIFYRWPGSWGLPGAFTGRYAGGEHIPAFDASRLTAVAEPVTDYPPVAALPERRAANDLGGRMDPSKGWKLSIADPSPSGSALGDMVARQQKAAPIALAADDHNFQGVQP
ncbi:Cell wall hydrolase SleB [Sphingobium herbicidovorans NBRC 16415]|uniref:Cell wall hydrolase SleB n=1 Tax=Sphingobium herbicidovorans (strain ATCC 700291 / DSM 11019 / CCUG 56400 / KCTC 2939 / LMG 18315 / NBRC 16415 / MH) TaxID=1219045 RepID=A0A086PCD5_SPHHM|nr:cell wall hydrolase [Sphingobium herbicidovorans]KFG91053.1 Cell wall hydrolase SleB [Sphingobium herbicidovorans NBRC 16415]